MITFSDLPIENENYDFFVPFGLKTLIGLQLKDANIPFTTTSWRDINQEQYATEIEEAKAFFTAHHCPWNPEMLEVIHCPIKPEQLRKKSLLFFGSTIDPDFQKAQEESWAESEENFRTNIEPDLMARSQE